MTLTGNDVALLVTGVVLLLTTAVATDLLHLPYELVSSPLTSVIMVLISLGAFSVHPVVGLSLLLLTAVLFFKRNLITTSSIRSGTMYGENSIALQKNRPAVGFSSQSSGPREYSQFNETNPGNTLLLGPQKTNEGFKTSDPAPYGDEQGAPVDGLYPKEQERPTGSPDSNVYTYRPDADTGSNAFTRDGPNIDEKVVALAYSQ